MNKKLFYIPFLVIVFTACATSPDAEISTTQQPEKTNSKAKKRGHQAIPEGVISLDIVNYNNRLHLLTGINRQGQKSLWYQNTDNGGKSWSKATIILNDNNLAVKMVRGNDAQIAAQTDNIAVTWTKYDETVRFNAGPMQAAHSADGGKTWKYTDTPPDWEKGPHGFIDMAADEHAMHTVWLDSRSGRSEVAASQGLRYAKSVDGGLSWQTNKTLDGLTCSCCWNTVKTDFNGNPYVLYRDKQPSDLSIGVIQNQHWQRLNHVGAFNWQFDGCPHIGGGLDFQQTNGQNRLHAVVGTGHQKHLGIHYLYSDDEGKNWSTALQLGNESAIHADIAAHDNGRVMAVWDTMGENGLTIYVAESQDQGARWSSPKQISKMGHRATHPRIVKTKKGFLALWTENDGEQQRLATLVL